MTAYFPLCQIQKHHHYVIIVYDHDRASVDVIEFGRKQESLQAYYDKIGKDSASNIKSVTMDMSDTFIAAAKASVKTTLERLYSIDST